MALQGADHVFVTGVYAASEDPIEGVSGETIVEAVKRHGETRCESVPDLESNANALPFSSKSCRWICGSASTSPLITIMLPAIHFRVSHREYRLLVD